MNLTEEDYSIVLWLVFLLIEVSLAVAVEWMPDVWPGSIKLWNQTGFWFVTVHFVLGPMINAGFLVFFIGMALKAEQGRLKWLIYSVAPVTCILLLLWHPIWPMRLMEFIG